MSDSIGGRWMKGLKVYNKTLCVYMSLCLFACINICNRVSVELLLRVDPFVLRYIRKYYLVVPYPS